MNKSRARSGTSNDARHPRVAFAASLIVVAIVVAFSAYAGSVWFIPPALHTDPDGLYKPVNALAGWVLAVGGAWAVASVALLLSRSAQPRRRDYVTASVLLGVVGWLGGMALSAVLDAPGLYAVVVLTVGDVLVATIIGRYIILRHLNR